MAANAVPFRSTIFYTTAGVPAGAGSVLTVGANGTQNFTSNLALNTLTASTMTLSAISFQSTTISLGQSTNQTYNNFTNGSFTAGWVSTLSTTASTAGAGLARVQRVTMSQSGQYQLAVQSSVASYSVVKSSDSGVTWQTLTNGANGLPAGSPAYTSISYSATGQYALAATRAGLYVSNNATAVTPTFSTIAIQPNIYLPFENSVTDVSGNSNPVVTGTPAFVAGQVGSYAFSMAANPMGGTAVTYIRGTLTNSNNFTVSGWFNATTVTDGNYAVIFSALGAGITLYIAKNVTVGTLTFFIGSSTAVYFTTSINANTWYSFTIVYQVGGVSSLTVNGTLIGSTSNTSPPIAGYIPTNQFGLGTYDNATTLAFKGYIDDFRIYTTMTGFTHTAVSATGQYMLAAASPSGGGGGLFQSTNFGQTWTQVNALLNGGVWTSLSQSASGQYALATTSAAIITPNLTGLAANTWTANGVSWAASASTTYAGGNPYMLFDNAAVLNNFWGSAQTYNTTSGAYSGSISTTVLGIGAVAGEWFQIQSSVPLVMYSYSYSSANFSCIAKTYYIVGSLDGTNWYPIQSASFGATNPFTALHQVASTYVIVNSASVQAFSVTAGTTGTLTTTTYSTTTNAYTYFRVIGTALWTSNFGLFQYDDFPINFVGGLTYTSNYGQTWSNVANSLFADSSAVSGDGQYTLGVANQSSSAAGYLPLDNSTAATGSGLTYSSTAGTVPFTTTARVGTHSANFSANTAGGASSNYLNYTVSSAFSFPAVFTMAAWIYPTAFPASGLACAVAFNNNTTSPGGPFIGINPTDNLIRFGVNATGGNINIYSLSAATINTWHHVVGVGLNGTAYLYVNGVLQSTNGYSGTPSVDGGGIITNLFVGANSIGAGGISFAGYVDDVRIYTTALTASAVSLLYATPTLNPVPSSSAYLGNNYLTSLSGSSYTPITLPNINAAINCASCSNTGQYMVVLTQGTTNNVYYSTNYGSTWTAITVGSSPMTSCAMSLDGTYITVSNATSVYTLNWNSQGYTLAIGSNAGAVNQASNAIAIGNNAGQTNQTANSIVLNASGAAVNPYTQGFYVAPIAQAISSTAPTFPLLGYGSDNQIVQSATSFSNSQQTVYGEWIQYQLATPSPITSYTLQGRNATAQRYPVSWIIVGSNDGTNWLLLDTQTGTSGWGTYTLTQVTAAYIYYRMIITQMTSTGYVDIGGFILNNGSPIFGSSANYTVVASGLYNVLQLNGTTVCTTTWSWPNSVPVNSLGIGADGPSGSALPPGWIPTTDGYTKTSAYFLGFYVIALGSQYEYNSSGIAFQGTSTTINTTVLGNTNMSGTLCLMGGSRVGIGSTMPQYTLDVAGTVQANGLIPASGQPDSAAVVPNSTFAQTWNLVTGLSTSAAWTGCGVSATGQYMTVCYPGYIYYSTNYGSTWTLATGYTAGTPQFFGVAISGSGQYQMVGNNIGSGTGPYVSSNYGATWSLSSYSWGAGVYGRAGALSYNGQYQYTFLSAGSVVAISSNYGVGFTNTTASITGTVNYIACSSSGQYVYVATNPNLYYSSNYGVTFTLASSGANWASVFCSSSGQYVTANVYGGGIYYSNNYGANFIIAANTASNNWSSGTCSSSGQYQMIVINGSYIYYSINYGISWTVSGSIASNFQYISMSQNGLYTISPVNGGAVYLSTLTNVGLVTNGALRIATANNAGGGTGVFNMMNTSGYGIYATSMSINSRGNTLDWYSYDYNSGTRTTRPILTMRPEGFVGIGITNPAHPLHIYNVYSSNPGILTLEQASTNPNYISFRSNGLTCAYIGLENNSGSGLFGSGTGYGLSMGTNANGGGLVAFSVLGYIRMTVGTVATAPYVDNTYACGYGTNRWTYVYAVNGTIQTSDPCRKVITPLPYGLEELLQVNPIKYKWKDEFVPRPSQCDIDNDVLGAYQDMSSFEYYGVNADEVHCIFPELVYHENPNNDKGLNYGELVPVCINAIKELHAMNLTQAEKIVSLESQLAAQAEQLTSQTEQLTEVLSRLAALESKS